MMQPTHGERQPGVQAKPTGIDSQRAVPLRSGPMSLFTGVAVLACWLLVVAAASGSSEVLGTVYVPLEEPQTGEPVVTAVPFMNSEPSPLYHAFRTIDKAQRLVVAGPSFTNMTDDINLVSVNGITLDVREGETSPQPYVTLNFPKSLSLDEDALNALMSALMECFRKTALQYGGTGFNLSIQTSDRAAGQQLRQFEGTHPVGRTPETTRKP